MSEGDNRPRGTNVRRVQLYKGDKFLGGLISMGTLVGGTHVTQPLFTKTDFEKLTD